jgi:hypothetical protein
MGKRRAWHFKVESGVIVLPDGVKLPEGLNVTITPSPSPTNAEATVWQKLEAVGRWAETQPCTLPPDLATNHDHYLHGRPKKV